VDRVEATFTKPLTNDCRNVLVEEDLHRSGTGSSI
jgi:hypothetical protein